MKQLTPDFGSYCNIWDTPAQKESYFMISKLLAHTPLRFSHAQACRTLPSPLAARGLT